MSFRAVVTFEPDGISEVDLDLSALPAASYDQEAGQWKIDGQAVDGWRSGAYFEALDMVLCGLMYAPEVVPERLNVVTPGGRKISLFVRELEKE